MVAVAEVAIYWGYIYKVKESIKTEKKIVETKTVVNTWVVGQGGDEVTNKDKERGVPKLIELKEEDGVTRRRRK